MASKALDIWEKAASQLHVWPLPTTTAYPSPSHLEKPALPPICFAPSHRCKCCALCLECPSSHSLFVFSFEIELCCCLLLGALTDSCTKLIPSWARGPPITRMVHNRLRTQTLEPETWGQIPVLLLTSYVTLGTPVINLSILQSPEL